jgi:gamma-glutamylputrescine oxidase
VDVAIVGGGLTGCIAAWVFSRARARVALLEAARVGQAVTGGSLGAILPSPGARFIELRDRYGLRAARGMWNLTRKSALEFMAALRRLSIRCDLSRCDRWQIALRDEDADALERESAALKEAGFDAAWMSAARVRQAAGFNAAGALKLNGAGSLDPYAACLGFARLAAAERAVIFEQTEARRLKVGRRNVEVVTPRGSITAGAVVIATDAPAAGLDPLKRHFRIEESYAVALAPMSAAARRRFGDANLLAQDSGAPPHAWRWVRDGRLLFSGASQPPVPAAQRAKALVQRTGQLMYELSLLYPHMSGMPAESSWSVRRSAPTDGVMVAGVHRAFPRHLFSLGLGRSGANSAWLAAHILARRWVDAAVKGDELFDFMR